MKIAIASGKGGTGKTTVATNLAALLSEQGSRVTYVDCDVEAPNGHLFLHPETEQETQVNRPVPIVDPGKCTHCGTCGRFCQFNALTCLPNTTLVHPELCHSCGGCSLVCPAHAIHEEAVSIGEIRTGTAGPLRFVSGTFTVGMANSTPVIKAAKEAGGNDGLVILDAPPGTSCAMMEAIRGCDGVILVTEPTPFGMHDLAIAIEVTRGTGIPFGVVINRSDEGSEAVRGLCEKEAVPILAELPDMRTVAEAYSNGKLAFRSVPEMKAPFESLSAKLAEFINSNTTGNIR